MSIAPKMTRPLYERDFVAWAETQARLLRAGRFAEVDLAKVVEEIESLGRSDRRALKREVGRLLAHLLKWMHQPEKRTRSWEDSIADARHRVAMLIEDSPSLRRELPEIFASEYPGVRRDAGRQTRLGAQHLPECLGISIEEALDPDFWPS